jgi:uncharacterized protein (TIGR00369 family)
MLWTSPDANLEKNVRASFGLQGALRAMGAGIERVEPGLVEIVLPFGEHLTQQNGFVHAGVITTIADSACGYAAATVAPVGANVLTVEFKINLLAPACGRLFRAVGRALRGGKRLTICQGDVFAEKEGESDRIHVAVMLATMNVRAVGYE